MSLPSLIGVFLLTQLVFGAQKDEDEVGKLPGVKFNLNFKLYSGYLNVTKNRQIHYVLAESQRDPSKDPVVIWLNGGPGCSSLEGFLSENGPFILPDVLNQTDYKLSQNPHSWNKTPAGVGFSINNDENFSYNDNTTAVDNRNALIKFFEIFPDLRKNELYITGESYAGCYIPTLADHILNNQDKYSINLKGVAIGNGITIKKWFLKFTTPFEFYHGLKTVEEYEDWRRSHCPSGLDNFCESKTPTTETQEEPTTGLLISKALQMKPSRRLNSYDIYRPCYGDLCVENADKAYLNLKNVQKALHVRSVSWNTCTYSVLGEYTWCQDMTPFVKRLLKDGVRVFYFYGDTDIACDFIQGGLFARKVGQKVAKRSEMWWVDNVWAGTRVVYERNLTFTTIAGVGHMAAEWKPKATARAIDFFIQGIDLTNSK